MIHYTDAELAAARTEHPGHFVIERITEHAACLVLIPDTEANRARIGKQFPFPDPAIIDGQTFHFAPPTQP
jgi:hypothetical protein